MAPTRVLILGHSFIHRLFSFLVAHFGRDFLENFNLGDDLIFKWHGIGGRTVAKTRQLDLGVVRSFAPDIVILQLGTNDLTALSAVETGSAIEDLVRLLYDSYSVKRICVCQTIYRENAPLFNNKANTLSKYLRVVLEPIPYACYWKHRGFWNSKSRFLHSDGVHLNNLGHFKLYRSLRGAILGCWRALSEASLSASYCVSFYRRTLRFLNVLSAVSYPAFYLRSSVFLSMFIASSHFLF